MCNSRKTHFMILHTHTKTTYNRHNTRTTTNHRQQNRWTIEPVEHRATKDTRTTRDNDNITTVRENGLNQCIYRWELITTYTHLHTLKHTPRARRCGGYVPHTTIATHTHTHNFYANFYTHKTTTAREPQHAVVTCAAAMLCGCLTSNVLAHGTHRWRYWWRQTARWQPWRYARLSVCAAAFAHLWPSETEKMYKYCRLYCGACELLQRQHNVWGGGGNSTRT